MTVGTHTVTFRADPHSDLAWAAPFNVNPEFATDIAGWSASANNQTWSWAGGQASGVSGTVTVILSLFPVTNVAKPAGTGLLRLTASVNVTNPNTRAISLRLGYSRTASSFDTYHESVTTINQLGTYTLELISDPSTVASNLTFLRPEVRIAEGDVTNIKGQTALVDYCRLQAAAPGALGTDLSCLVDQVSIQHGRADSDTQPDASSCTLDLSTDNTGQYPWPAILDVGGVITVTTTLPTLNSTRFVGRVTDITQGWEDAGPDTPDMATGQVIATGVLADLGRRTVGDAPWPQQLDGARVGAILSAAGMPLDAATSDPGTVQVLARDVDSQPALDLAQAVATDAGGILWATRAGAVRYADANHRRGTIAALEMDACDVLVTPTWRRTTEGLVNDVSIGYGVAPAGGGEQPRYTNSRPDSITKWGEYGLSMATQLAALADAEAMGLMLLTRNSQPVWVMSDLPVDLAHLTDAETNALLSLEMHSLIHLTGLPASGSVPTSAFLWLEGWAETLAHGEHDFRMVVSGYCRTSPAPRWNDLAPEATWDTAAGTWDDATCQGPPANLGRWDDQPASLRWDQVPPTTTWDNFVPN